MQRFFFFFLTAFLLAGCCKMACVGDELFLSFEKFKAVDTDSVLVVNYRPGTQQRISIDTVALYTPVLAGDTTRSRLFYNIKADFDWKILLPSLNRQFVLSDFVLTSKRCQCGGNRYKSIETYRLNGARKEVTSLEILE